MFRCGPDLIFGARIAGKPGICRNRMPDGPRIFCDAFRDYIMKNKRIVNIGNIEYQ